MCFKRGCRREIEKEERDRENKEVYIYGKIYKEVYVIYMYGRP